MLCRLRAVVEVVTMATSRGGFKGFSELSCRKFSQDFGLASKLRELNAKYSTNPRTKL